MKICDICKQEAKSGYVIHKECVEELRSKLEKYETLEREGRVMILPCKFGDAIYDPIISEITGERFVGDDCRIGRIGFEILHKGETEGFEALDEIGKTVFLTREEAEAVLAAQEGK